MPTRTIAIRGARTHNLKNISVDIPQRQLTVLTGPSAHIDEEFPEQSDFEIEEVAFCDELDRWLEPS